MKNLFERLDQKKQLLNANMPLPVYTAKSLREKMELDWIYHSNAIEGNTLTLQETKVVLEGITVGGKTLREHREVVNHLEAIQYVEDMVNNEEHLNEWHMKNLHHLILKGILDEYAGIYRTQLVQISGASHTPPAPYLIKDEMEKLTNWYDTTARDLHPIERAALLHSIYVGIHPFVDGNGRTARLLLNLELLNAGFQPVILKVENRLSYYEALDKAISQNKTEDFIHIVANALEESLDLY